MAKDLPYFKFFVSEWNDGDITLEDYDTQGLFINLCAYYWSNECNITLTKAKKKFRHCPEKCFDFIIESKAIKVVNDVITINFLDEQSKERKAQHDVKSKGGKASAEVRRLKKLAEQETNTPSTEDQQDSTGIQQVLKSSSTEVQLLREEEIRREKKREEDIIKKDIKYNAFFDLFWSSYDKKVGDISKLKVKFKKLSEHDIGLMMDYIPRYKMAQTDKQYRKNPETFINNKGWLDELIMPPKKKVIVNSPF